MIADSRMRIADCGLKSAIRIGSFGLEYTIIQIINRKSAIRILESAIQ